MRLSCLPLISLDAMAGVQAVEGYRGKRATCIYSRDNNASTPHLSLLKHWTTTLKGSSDGLRLPGLLGASLDAMAVLQRGAARTAVSTRPPCAQRPTRFYAAAIAASLTQYPY